MRAKNTVLILIGLFVLIEAGKYVP